MYSFWKLDFINFYITPKQRILLDLLFNSWFDPSTTEFYILNKVKKCFGHIKSLMITGSKAVAEGNTE